MRFLAIALISMFVFMTFTSTKAYARCDYSWQTAKDGSQCGDRAASRRPGGR